MFYYVHTNIVGITKLAVRIEVQTAQQRAQQPEATHQRDKKRQPELEKDNEGQNEVE